ncbi:MAG: ABC transporter substrate-binding protein [Firmicutes bacterium]|nr:ABC transporter substrate-binding protein [Bacillota bacterium]
MSKRLIAVVLTVGLVLSLTGVSFAAVKLVFWDMFSGGDGEFMTAMIKEFNETHPDIEVEETVITWGDYYNRIMTASLAGKGPDVGVMHSSHIPAYASKGALLELDAELARLNFPADDFAPGAWEGGKYNGKQYAIPLDAHPVVMYYNKDLLAQAGLLKDGLPDLPEDPDGFLAAMQKIKVATGKTPITFESNGFGSYRVWHATLHQAGGDLLTSDAQKIAANSETGRKTLAFWVELLKTFDNVISYDESVEMFAQGDCAIHLNGAWVTGMFEQTEGLNFGAGPFPSIFGGRQSWANSHNFIIPRPRQVEPEKINATLTFIDWMTANSDKWSLAGHIPVRRSVAESAAFNALKYQPQYAAQADNLAYLPGSVHMLELESLVADEIVAAFAGAKTVEEALATIEDKGNEILAQ